MVDTVRTDEEILALLADNTSRAISPQDIRDAYVTLNAQITTLENAIGLEETPAIGYQPLPVNFDGSTYLTVDADPGLTTTRKVTGSFWFRRTSTGAQQRIFSDPAGSADNGFRISFTSDNKLQFVGQTAANTLILHVQTGGLPAITDTAWHHCMFSFGLDEPSRNRWVNIDGVDTLSSGVFTFTDDDIDLASTTWGFGADPTGTETLSADIADFVLWFGQYNDLTPASANALLFLTAEGAPVDPDVAIAALGTPDVAMVEQDIDLWGDNASGSFAAFSVAAGTIAEGTGPVTRVEATSDEFLQAGTGAVERTFLVKAREVFSVLDFGAVPNTSLSTEGVDTSTAINAAIDAAAELFPGANNFTPGGSNRVYLPAGVYWIDASILGKPNVHLCGAGWSNTIIKLKAGAACHAFKNGTSSSQYGIMVSDLTLDGNMFATGNSTVFYDGINIASTVDTTMVLRNVRIRWFTRDGVKIRGSRGLAYGTNVIVRNVLRHGMYIQTTDNFWVGCEVSACGADGIRLSAGPNSFSGGKSYFCGNDAWMYDRYGAVTADQFTNVSGQAMPTAAADADGTERYPVQDDWERGCGIYNTSFLNQFVGWEIQDTFGPGIVLGDSGGRFRYNGHINNVGDIAPGGPRFSDSGNDSGDPDWVTDRYDGVRAAVEVRKSNANQIEFSLGQQERTFGAGGDTKCDYPVRWLNTNAAENTIKANIHRWTNAATLTASTHVANELPLNSATPDASNKYICENPRVLTAADDATPSVASAKEITLTNTGAITITALDDGVTDQEVLVKFGSDNFTVDFTGTTLKGNGGADWTPSSGDAMLCKFDGTNWYCSTIDTTA